MPLDDVLTYFVRHLHLMQQLVLFKPILLYFPNVILNENGASSVTNYLLDSATCQLFLRIVPYITFEAWLMIGCRAIVSG